MKVSSNGHCSFQWDLRNYFVWVCCFSAQNPPTSLRLLSLFLHNPSRAVVGSAIAVVATGGWDLVFGITFACRKSLCMHACMCVGIAQVLYVAIDRIPFILSFFLSLFSSSITWYTLTRLFVTGVWYVHFSLLQYELVRHCLSRCKWTGSEIRAGNKKDY